MTQQHSQQYSEIGPTPAQRWAEYEQQVAAADVRWRTYEKASAAADVMLNQYQAAAQVRGEAYMAWCKANRVCNGLLDAYLASLSAA